MNIIKKALFIKTLFDIVIDPRLNRFRGYFSVKVIYKTYGCSNF